MADGIAIRFDGNPYTSAQERLLATVLAMPSAANLARPGIRPGPGGAVSVGGTPEAVTVQPFCGIVTDAAGGGSYLVVIPSAASVNLATRPAGGTSRVDELVLLIKNVDERPTDVIKDVDVAVITGTAGASPSAPSIPTGQLRIRELAVPAGGSVSLSKPPARTVALGGILPVATSAERDAIEAPYDGLMVYREDTDTFEGRVEGAWASLGGKTHSCHVQRAAAQSIGNGGAGTTVPWDTEVRDTSSMWAIGNPTKVIVPVAGRYRITGRASLATTTAGIFNLMVAVGGTDVAALFRGSTAAASVQPQFASGVCELDLSAGDEVTLRIFQNVTGGASVNTSTGPYACELIVESLV